MMTANSKTNCAPNFPPPRSVAIATRSKPMSRTSSTPSKTGTPSTALTLDVRASAFQAQVWEALRAIPVGETRTYGEIARTLGVPKGTRAVGRACATNPVSLVIPCHRAVREDGGLGGYRWGLARKQALLDRERE